MVMIPVGNNTKHCFRLWCFAEMYIRVLITAVVFNHLPDEEYITKFVQILLTIIFTLWCMRPVYLNIKSLYSSWVWAKHKAESNALSEVKE